MDASGWGCQIIHFLPERVREQLPFPFGALAESPVRSRSEVLPAHKDSRTSAVSQHGPVEEEEEYTEDESEEVEEKRQKAEELPGFKPLSSSLSCSVLRGSGIFGARTSKIFSKESKTVLCTRIG